MADYQVTLGEGTPISFELPATASRQYQLTFEDTSTGASLTTSNSIVMDGYNHLYQIDFQGRLGQVSSNRFAVFNDDPFADIISWGSDDFLSEYYYIDYIDGDYTSQSSYLFEELASKTISTEGMDSQLEDLMTTLLEPSYDPTYPEWTEAKAAYEAILLDSYIAIPIKVEGGQQSFSQIGPWSGMPFAHIAARDKNFLIGRASLVGPYYDPDAGFWTDFERNALRREIEQGSLTTFTEVLDYLKQYATPEQTPCVFPVLRWPDNWDIFKVTTWDDVLFLSQLYLPLVRPKKINSKYPDFPRSLPEINPDIITELNFDDEGNSIFIAISDGIKWSDGSPVTAENFVAGIKRALDCNGLLGSIWSNVIKGAVDYQRGSADWSEVGISNNDDYSFTIETVSSYVNDYSLFTPYLQLLFPFSEDNLSDIGEEKYGNISEVYYMVFTKAFEVDDYSGNFRKLRISYENTPLEQYGCSDLVYFLLSDETDLDNPQWWQNVGSQNGAVEYLDDLPLLSDLFDEMMTNFRTFTSSYGSRERMLFYNVSKPSIARRELEVPNNADIDPNSQTIQVLRSWYLRKALTCAIDRLECFIKPLTKGDEVGEPLSLVNTFTTNESNDYYDRVQSYLSNDLQSDITVYANDERTSLNETFGVGLSQGYDGFYNPELAEECYRLAVDELKNSFGVDIDNTPIRLRVAFNERKDSEIAYKYLSALSQAFASWNTGLFLEAVPLRSEEMDDIFNKKDGSTFAYDILISDRYLVPTALLPNGGVIPAFFKESDNYQNLAKFCGMF